ncbi:NUDIX hydrolase [Virgibacillus kekensis]|uniref:NUDIX hydrolase n=1 Tax=Virgibacillus kekensis TaxID=202261 RepID=A0ABV9DP41_9BACI
MEYIKELRKLVGSIPLIVCTAGVIITDNSNRILLIKRTDDGNWCIPGGAMDMGESVEETARREVYEETGLSVGQLKLLNVYSGEQQHHIYPNGDEVYFVNVIFSSSLFQGNLRTDGDESKEAAFFSLNNLPANISPTNLPFISDIRRIG